MPVVITFESDGNSNQTRYHHRKVRIKRKDLKYLVVTSWVRNDEKTRLTESLLDLIGECTWSKATSDWDRSSIVGKLENGTLEKSENQSYKLVKKQNGWCTGKQENKTGRALYQCWIITVPIICS